MSVPRDDIELIAQKISARSAAIATGAIPVEDYRRMVESIADGMRDLEVLTATGPEGQDWYMMPGAVERVRGKEGL